MLRSLTNNCKAKTVYDRMNPNKGCEFGENPCHLYEMFACE